MPTCSSQGSASAAHARVDAVNLRIGLTGGIGSGKTTVSDRFAELGIDVIDADVISRALTAPGGDAVAAVIEAFGDGVADAGGALDRDALRRRVFADPGERRRLEAIVHPMVRREMALQEAASTTPYCIVSIPLLVESQEPGRVDRVLVVDAPDALRRQWIQARSGLSEVEIDGIFAAQASREQRLAAADDVIVNDGTIEQLHEQVDALHARYLALAETARDEEDGPLSRA